MTCLCLAKELPVVSGHHNCSLRGSQRIGEFIDQRDGEVVGGFIEKKHMWPRGEYQCKVETTVLPR